MMGVMVVAADAERHATVSGPMTAAVSARLAASLRALGKDKVDMRHDPFCGAAPAQSAHDTPVIVSLGLLVRALGSRDLLIYVPRSSGSNPSMETEWTVIAVRITRITVNGTRLF